MAVVLKEQLELRPSVALRVRAVHDLRQWWQRAADLCWWLFPSVYPVTLLAYPSG